MDPLSALQRTLDTRGPLSAEAERETATRARAGDQQARDELVLANLRFAVTMARKHRKRGLDDDDLVQEAAVGLILAAGRFDPDRKVKFISYAAWWVRHSIAMGIHRGQPVRIPRNRAGQLGSLVTERERLRHAMAGWQP
jgi:DNA-directed RNA polymerase sigma subunit (sigma70/sigma32)